MSSFSAIFFSEAAAVTFLVFWGFLAVKALGLWDLVLLDQD